jgi:hypothetical protein
MKKIVMTMVAACAALTMNAQMYVGGTVGFGSDKSKTATVETTKNSLTIAPEFGMALDEKMGVGIELNFTNGSTETKPISGATGTTTKPSSTTFGIKPYVRYQVFSFGKANIFVDGGVNFAISKDKEVGYDATGKAIDNKAGMDLGLFVQPGFAFNITDSWSIVAKLENMFTFTYSKGQVADVAGAPDAPTSINARLASGGFNTGNLRFGVYYNF